MAMSARTIKPGLFCSSAGVMVTPEPLPSPSKARLPLALVWRNTALPLLGLPWTTRSAVLPAISPKLAATM